jgi:hypothetical protein
VETKNNLQPEKKLETRTRKQMRENQRLRTNLLNKRKAGLTLQKTVSLAILFSLDLITLLLATVYSSSISALIGLGLTFWGIVLLYIETEEYAGNTILNATATSHY